MLPNMVPFQTMNINSGMLHGRASVQTAVADTWQHEKSPQCTGMEGYADPYALLLPESSNYSCPDLSKVALYTEAVQVVVSATWREAF